jgi:hypothetical protein
MTKDESSLQTKDESSTLNELITRYYNEPGLCDIYVEGNTDKHLITWFLKQHGYLANQDFHIYDGSEVNISREELEERGLIDNNRSRVIAIALKIQKELGVMPKYLSCLVDKDSDWLFRKEYPSCEGLLFSDYCDLEMYLFNEAVIDKFLHLVLGTSKISANQLLDKLSPVLIELFLIRTTSHQALQWGMGWLSFDAVRRCLELTGTTIKFDFYEKDSLIDKYLNNNNKWSDKSRFLEKLEELRLSSKSLPDPRYKIRGHDFTSVLYWYLNKSVKIKVKEKVIKQPIEDSNAIGGSLLGCVELEQLKQEKLFKQLLARMPPLTKDV